MTRDSSRVVELRGRSILICYTKDRYYAVANLCSHADEKLECGRVRGGWVACPAHGARFDLATGRAMNPPATRPIETFPTRIAGDWLEIEIE